MSREGSEKDKMISQEVKKNAGQYQKERRGGDGLREI